MAETFPKRLLLAQRQMDGLRTLLSATLPNNPFYSAKFEAAEAPRKISHLGDFAQRIPFTTKQELVADQAANPPYGTDLTYPLERYTRCHQTSGTTSLPLRWLDTPQSWDWMVRTWEYVLRTAGVTADDRVLFASSFGLFIGFWLAFEASLRVGCLTLPSGGMNTLTRLRLILDHQVTVVCCTPTYALRLAEVARAEGLDLSVGKVRLLIVAGEPGGSIPATRQRIEELWLGGRAFDHHGMTEVGPVTHECPARPGVLHVVESAFIPEVIDLATTKPVEPGETGELVLTPLGRTGSPLLRYRTGDLVRPALNSICECGRSDLALEGGILGRVDDMVIVRGVNVYPSAVEEIVRGCGGVVEYQVQVTQDAGLSAIQMRIEPEPGGAETPKLIAKLEQSLSNAFGLHIPVVAVPAGTLPRFESKAQRWIR